MLFMLIEQEKPPEEYLAGDLTRKYK